MHGSVTDLYAPHWLAQFGKILTIDIKRPARPPYFAFVEFADARQAAMHVAFHACTPPTPEPSAYLCVGMRRMQPGAGMALICSECGSGQLPVCN